jgi:hypothetical protein
MERGNGFVVSGLVVWTVATAGCAPARMAVPKDVGGASDEIAITDRSGMSGALVDESFKMGPYQVTDVDRKWTSSSGSSFAGFSSGSTKAGYAFALKAPEGAYKGQCASFVDEKSVGLLGGAFGKQNFDVLCECAGPAQATFSIKADTTSQYRGKVNARSTTFDIEGIYNDEKGSSSSTAIGYYVHGTEPVGAVEVVGKGRVWLNKSLDAGTRADVACLFAGLLLHKPPSESMTK